MTSNKGQSLVWMRGVFRDWGTFSVTKHKIGYMGWKNKNAGPDCKNRSFDIQRYLEIEEQNTALICTVTVFQRGPERLWQPEIERWRLSMQSLIVCTEKDSFRNVLICVALWRLLEAQLMRSVLSASRATSASCLKTLARHEHTLRIEALYTRTAVAWRLVLCAVVYHQSGGAYDPASSIVDSFSSPLTVSWDFRECW